MQLECFDAIGDAAITTTLAQMNVLHDDYAWVKKLATSTFEYAGQSQFYTMTSRAIATNETIAV